MEYNFKWKNNGRTKLCIGLGTRPEIIRLAAVIKRAREYFDTCVVYYNQNWDKNLSTVFWEDFELKNNEGEFGPDILVMHPFPCGYLHLDVSIFLASVGRQQKEYMGSFHAEKGNDQRRFSFL